jgi:hypothetical protein
VVAADSPAVSGNPEAWDTRLAEEDSPAAQDKTEAVADNPAAQDMTEAVADSPAAQGKKEAVADSPVAVADILVGDMTAVDILVVDILVVDMTAVVANNPVVVDIPAAVDMKVDTLVVAQFRLDNPVVASSPAAAVDIPAAAVDIRVAAADIPAAAVDIPAGLDQYLLVLAFQDRTLRDSGRSTCCQPCQISMCRL